VSVSMARTLLYLLTIGCLHGTPEQAGTKVKSTKLKKDTNRQLGGLISYGKRQFCNEP
jgi:hypothetical protein